MPDTPRLPRPSTAARPASFPRAKVPEYPALEAAAQPKVPEPFVVTREVWEDLRKSQGNVLHALSTNGRKIEKIKHDHV